MSSSPSDGSSVSASTSEIVEDDENKDLLGDLRPRDNVNDRQRDGRHREGSGNHRAARAWKWLRQIFIRSTRLLLLNEKSSAALMAFISNLAVMGIVTLNIYSASYFLSWKKNDSICRVFPDPTSDVKINGAIQLVVIGLPFACLPLSLCIGSLAEVTKNETRYLECVAILVMVEIIYTVFLGAVMTMCMSDVLGKHVAVTAGIIVGLLLLFWAWCCRYPVCWRHVMCCKCLCVNIDEVQMEDLV